MESGCDACVFYQKEIMIVLNKDEKQFMFNRKKRYVHNFNRTYFVLKK